MTASAAPRTPLQTPPQDTPRGIPLRGSIPSEGHRPRSEGFAGSTYPHRSGIHLNPLQTILRGLWGILSVSPHRGGLGWVSGWVATGGRFRVPSERPL